MEHHTETSENKLFFNIRALTVEMKISITVQEDSQENLSYSKEKAIDEKLEKNHTLQEKWKRSGPECSISEQKFQKKRKKENEGKNVV